MHLHFLQRALIAAQYAAETGHTPPGWIDMNEERGKA